MNTSDDARHASDQTGFTYRLADVFAESSYQGNGVAVFLNPPRLTTGQLQAVTVEVRQFESIYLWPTADDRSFVTRIFVVDQELRFAGHPILGAAAVAHEQLLAAEPAAVPPGEHATWTFRLGSREVIARSVADNAGGFDIDTDQGRPSFGEPMPPAYRERIAHALRLQPGDLDPTLPVEWASTGLKYLIVPVSGSGLARARITIPDFEELLGEAGAELAYVLDPSALEGRNWVNDGSVEDIATGSAAGPAAAYLVRHGRVAPESTVALSQGRFVGRPSALRVEVHGPRDDISRVVLHGHVCLTGTGTLDHPPVA
ncbi:PhzF family phenazine biosynthesis protein [Flexivirga alba]|uniref:PhzF family phenazine biosynthesis protein n=1 Tax=Flexivirga alba TaxID=702742 RepID=A0ABW2ADI3_9MICO